MTLTAKSTDGAAHKIQYYTDISAGKPIKISSSVVNSSKRSISEWVSGDNSLTAKWSTTTLTTNGGSIVHQVQLQNPSAFAEVNDHTQYGSAYYGTNQVHNCLGSDIDSYLTQCRYYL